MENPNITIANNESFETEVQTFNFNYDNLTIEFSPDKTQIKPDGSFFKGAFMSYKEITDKISELSSLEKTQQCTSESSLKMNAYFLGLLNTIKELFPSNN